MTVLSGEFQSDLPVHDVLVACAEAVDGLGWEVETVEGNCIVSYPDSGSPDPPRIEVLLSAAADSTEIRITGRDGGTQSDLIAVLDRARDAIANQLKVIEARKEIPPDGTWQSYSPASGANGQTRTRAPQPPPTESQLKQCPDCAEQVQVGASVCRYCGYRFDTGESATNARSEPSNGMAVTAFVLGLIGAVIGLVIAVFAYFIPLILGLAAVPLGLIARSRAKRRGVGRKGLATWGVVLGLLSVTWGIVGAVAFNDAVNDLDRGLSTHCLNHPNASDCQ